MPFVCFMSLGSTNIWNAIYVYCGTIFFFDVLSMLYKTKESFHMRKLLCDMAL